MTTELQETKVCIGEVTYTGKQRPEAGKKTQISCLSQKNPLAASELPLLFKAKQIFFFSLKQDSI